MGEVKVKHPYITRKQGVCGGRPIITGTRIRVMDVAIEYELLGYTPHQIIEAHPHINLAQVHDALSFYYENKEEIDRAVKEAEKVEARFRKRYPPKLKDAQD